MPGARRLGGGDERAARASDPVRQAAFAEMAGHFHGAALHAAVAEGGQELEDAGSGGRLSRLRRRQEICDLVLPGLFAGMAGGVFAEPQPEVAVTE